MNNKVIDIYESKDGHLILKIYNQETGKIEALKRDEDVEMFLRKLEHYPIIEVKEEVVNNKEYEFVKYPGFNLQMHDIEHMDKQMNYLNPLVDSLKKHFENEKLKELNNKPYRKRKVQRTNKYTNKKIMAAFLATGILISTMAITFFNTLDNLSNSSTDIDEIITEALEYRDMNPESFYEYVVDNGVGIEQNIEGINSNYITLDYEDFSTTDKATFTREQYGDIMEKYATMYGLDANLMLGIATQERGVHSSERDKGGATGLMQIQNSVWLGKEISAYNFETGKYDKFVVNNDMIENVDTNIQLGCMIFQNCLDYVDYNIPMAVQCYNYGIGNMRKVIDVYANASGQTREDVIANQNDAGWLEYRDIINVGDTNYLNNVFSWMGEENTISVMKKDNTVIDLTISNNLQANKTY